MTRPALPVLALTVMTLMASTGSAHAGQSTTTGSGSPPVLSPGGQSNWTSHNLDLHNQRFSPLDQVDRDTVGDLAERWQFAAPPGQSITQVTPLVVDGVMYLHAPQTLYALDATSGEMIWSLELESAHPSPVRDRPTRTVRCSSTTARRLSRPTPRRASWSRASDRAGCCPSWAPRSRPSIRTRIRRRSTPGPSAIASRPRPRITTARSTCRPRSPRGTSRGGLVIATDAETGAITWVFNTIPQRPQDDGWDIAQETWGTGAKAGGGIWTQPALDLELGLVYVNSGNPSPDYDGSARPGMNLFTNSTIALDMETGALEWYYQTIHHDLWDWDNVTGPVLFDVEGPDGEVIKGVGAAGKNCLLYLWHRDTGEPIHPMVETLVPTETNVPGEVVYPTQPIPHNARGVPMTPFCATYVEVDDPEQRSRSRQMYTPYSIDEHLIVAHGGSSFGSPAFSPRTGLLYVSGKNGAISMIVRPVGDSLEPGPDSRGHTESFEDLSRIPDYEPSFTVTAYDPATGEEAWQQVLPAISSIGASGNLVTAGDIVFQGTDAGDFYGLDAETGDPLFTVNVRRPIRSSPLTYQVNGTQYVSIIASDTILTYALP